MKCLGKVDKGRWRQMQSRRKATTAHVHKDTRSSENRYSITQNCREVPGDLLSAEFCINCIKWRQAQEANKVSCLCLSLDTAT